jgi:galactonate dehydratase
VPLVQGRDPHDVVAISEDIYNAMRVRGFFGGFYVDALAGLDIALWDLRGKLTGLPICKLLGAQRRTQIPAYVSGLPKATREERAALAKEWIDKGFRAVKFAAAVAHDGEVAEMQAIRAAIGPEAQILVDFHWRYTAQEAIKLITALEAYDLAVAEAPVQSEDLEGQARVVAAVKTPVAIGEELRTIYEYRPRFVHHCMSIIQPEMAHMGITSFWEVCRMAQAFHCKVMPHATIGVGIAQAASLQVAAALPNLVMHEYQHSIFDRNLQFITGNMRCEAGYFQLPEGPGLGVEPRAEVFGYVMA